MSESGQFVYDAATNTFSAADEDGAYSQPWELINPSDYVSVPGIGGPPSDQPTYSREAPKPLTSVTHGNGQATVQSNQPMSISGSSIFTGSFGANIPAGATFTGRDSNGNRIPDLLEKCLRDGNCRFHG